MFLSPSPPYCLITSTHRVLPIPSVIPPSTTLNTTTHSYSSPALATPPNYREHYHHLCHVLLLLTPTTQSNYHYREHYPYRCHHPLLPYGCLPHHTSSPTRHSIPPRPTLPLPLPPPQTTMRLPGLLPHTPIPHTLLNTLPPPPPPPCLPPLQCCTLTQFGNCSGEPLPERGPSEIRVLLWGGVA